MRHHPHWCIVILFIFSLFVGTLLSGNGDVHAAQAVGTWANVTPSGVSLTAGACGNYGTQTVVTDPTRPSNLYVEFNCQGIWRSTDYGQTWTGPINTGTNGACVSDAAAQIAIASGGSTNPPILYQSAIRGCGIGFWRSTDGGTNWANFPITPAPSGRQDVYGPAIDPYDSNHLVLTAHELNAIYQSTNGGQTWTSVPMAGGMNENGGTGILSFINTGGASSTRGNWLWLAQGTGGSIGTWRTTDGGAHWTKVDNNEHAHGSSQIYQPDSGGTVYMAGIYSALGWGVLRSTDYGISWAHVGGTGAENAVFGTPNRVYAGYGWACASCGIDPSLESAPQPGSSGWAAISKPAVMTEGIASTATTFDGTNYVILTANWTGGLYRYVEPSVGTSPTPTPTATPTPGTVPGSIKGLRVSGNQILNDSGQAVHLRGVNRSGSEYMCTGSNLVFDGPTDQAAIDAMKAWQINVVRVPVNESCWLGINGMPQQITSAAYQAAIVDYVNRLNTDGIAVIIDLHWAESGTAVPSYNLQQMPNTDHSIAFWQSAANVFKSNSSVILDLFNEPFPNNNTDNTTAWSCLRDGRAACPTMTNTQGQAYTAVGMQELVSAIRATGATNIIQVPGVQFTDSVSQWLAYKPNDPLDQLAADWHVYQGQVCTAQSCWDANVAPVTEAVPVISGEIGENDCSHQWLDPLMDWLDARNAGYLGWAWDTYDCGSFPSLISNYDGTPTNFGIGLKDHLSVATAIPTATPVPTQPATLVPTSTSTPVPVITATPTATVTCEVNVRINGVAKGWKKC